MVCSGLPGTGVLVLAKVRDNGCQREDHESVGSNGTHTRRTPKGDVASSLRGSGQRHPSGASSGALPGVSKDTRCVIHFPTVPVSDAGGSPDWGEGNWHGLRLTARPNCCERVDFVKGVDIGFAAAFPAVSLQG